MTTPERLSTFVTEELITYLGSGKFNSQELARSIDYSGLAIQDLDQLKELHFVLYKDVIEYVEALQGRLRRLKTINRRERETVHGEVRGRIDWHRTRQRRYQTGYDDPTLFVVDTPEIEYDISENRVVKKLLATIARPLQADIAEINQDWRQIWAEQDIVALQRTLKQNVHLNRLPAPDTITVRKRDLTVARQSRQPLYTEAARLYSLYEDFLNDQYRPAVQELLETTLVVPNQDATLFELFCIFAILRRLSQQFPDVELQRVEPGMDAIARLESVSQRIEVYYDQTGPLSFFESYPTSKTLKSDYEVPEAIARQAQALEDHKELVSEFLDRGAGRTFYQGRPDFLILRYDTENTAEDLAELAIGEVKYTSSDSTFSAGLRELLEYMHFVQNQSKYLYQKAETDSVAITGVLCTDNVQTKTVRAGPVEHLTTASLESLFDD